MDEIIVNLSTNKKALIITFDLMSVHSFIEYSPIVNNKYDGLLTLLL